MHYLTHAWTVVRQFGPVIEAISRDEMRHFKWLAHTIVALGGVPDMTPRETLTAFSGLEALNYDIDAEEEAISQYLAHQRVIADERVQGLIGRIVVDERDHRRQFIHLRETWKDADCEASGEDALTGERAERFQILVAKEYQEILRHLLDSFLTTHLRHVGLNAEDRAIDEMKHLSLVAETMADLGGRPRFSLKEADREDELSLYRDLRGWAESEMKSLVPLIDRLIAHEEYQLVSAPDTGWTVGSTAKGGLR
ncbi:ferritin-like domain-containing protein [Sulfobacillus harzensis]|uniref:Rubrerythrin n=1 Tax=Sulfobacillus harzensis TaxID=2729629 RepID=A0A7Y0L295_9FIRM|nr:rubrerythrin [Sulfobacillus harzensis]